MLVKSFLKNIANSNLEHLKTIVVKEVEPSFSVGVKTGGSASWAIFALRAIIGSRIPSVMILASPSEFLLVAVGKDCARVPTIGLYGQFRIGSGQIIEANQ